MKYHSKKGKNHGHFVEAGRFMFLARGRIIKNSMSAVIKSFVVERFNISFQHNPIFVTSGGYNETEKVMIIPVQCFIPSQK
jgi:hypothetical protein